MRFFILLLLGWWTISAAAEQASIVDGVRANMRSGKSSQHPVVGVATPSDRLEVLVMEKHHVRVRTQDGVEGWVPRRLIQLAPASESMLGEAAPAEIAPASLSPLHAAEIEFEAPAAGPVSATAEADRTIPPGAEQVAAPASPVTGQRMSLDVLNMDSMGSLLLLMIAFLVGAAAGASALEYHYRKRLNGLRI